LRVRPWVTNAQARRLYVDPTDHRAWRLAMHSGALDIDAIRAWHLLARLIEPDLVLDVGANYGEVILSADYPVGADIHLVEPNPRLVRLLRRSISEAALPATVHQVAASDGSGVATMKISPKSSGTSTLEPRPWPTYREIEVETSRIDDFVQPGHRRCLFKIDVEGHEGAVLAGMAETLAGCERWFGLIEHRQGNFALDPALIPNLYAVRLDDLSLQVITPEVQAQLDVRDGRFSKDLVASSHPACA
jgi:FkbM family methyltransferase